MGFLDFLFKNKEEERENITSELSYDDEIIDLKNHCAKCKERFNPHDRSIKYDKKRYHIKCKRKMVKEARKIVFG